MYDDHAAPHKRSARPPPLQYKLKHLFILTLVASVFCGLVSQCGGAGFAVSVLVAFLTMMACGAAMRQPWLFAGGMSMSVVTAASLLLMTWMAHEEEKNTRGWRCQRNMRWIGVALLNYESKNGSFPPAYISDENGRPVHSWRVLILPYLEEQELYDQYDFDEPWDGPNNRKLADQMPDVFKCPAHDPKVATTTTSYAAVVGPRTAWPGETPRKIREITDGTAKTISVVEAADSGIHWMAPRDLQMTQLDAAENGTTGQGLSSKHRGGVVLVSFVDGFVFPLSGDLDPETLKALLTVDGGEEVNLEDL